MNRATPPVSVLMPVYNGARHVRAAIESVLAQTFGDFEFLILDDGSTDATATIAAGYGDPRIRLVVLPHGGFCAALNHGLDIARGRYVARMDHDDVCRPKRLAAQVRFMDAHPEIGIAGGFVRAQFPDGTAPRWRFPCDPEELRAGLLFEPGIAHPTAILRMAAMDRHALRYDARWRHVEDWDLWRRAADCFPLANLPRVVLDYRVHDARMSSVHGNEQQARGRALQNELLDRLGLATHPLRSVHDDVSLGTLRCADRDPAFLGQVADWFDTLREANDVSRRYEPAALDAFLADRMLLVLHSNLRLRARVLAMLFGRGWLRRARGPSALRLLARTALPWRVQVPS